MRRRRPKVTWFPTLGALTGVENSDKDITGLDGALDVPWADNAAGALAIFPLTNDAPQGEDPAETVSLAEVLGSEYFLRRIVGKLFLQVADQESFFSTMQIAAGFLVARAEQGDSGLPAGSNNLSTDPSDEAAWNNFSPLSTQTMREPWIWRRKWILSLEASTATTGFPNSNIHYGSVLDGPHIDAKTKRRISNDDRLFFAIAGAAWPVDTPLQSGTVTETQMRFNLDYRLVGSLRKARNRGVF